MNDNGHPAPNPRELLGGYATGSLTDAEQKALFEAALTDHTLFEELMREQALKETLAAPGVRRELIAALEPKPARRWQWTWAAWSAAGALAATAVIGIILTREPKPQLTATSAPKRVERMQESAPPAETRRAPEPEAKLAEKPAPKEMAARAKPKKETPPPQQDLPAAPIVASAPAQAPAAVAIEAQPIAAPSAEAAGAAAPGALADAASIAPKPIEYGILRGDDAGVFRPIASGAELTDGDRFKITVTPRANGPLVVTALGRTGATIVARLQAQAGATAILPTEQSLRAGDVQSLVLEFGMPSPPDARKLLQFGRSAARAKSAAPPTEGVRIEIPIGRR